MDEDSPMRKFEGIWKTNIVESDEMKKILPLLSDDGQKYAFGEIYKSLNAGTFDATFQEMFGFFGGFIEVDLDSVRKSLYEACWKAGLVKPPSIGARVSTLTLGLEREYQGSFDKRVCEARRGDIWLLVRRGSA